LTVTADDQTKVYGQSDPALTYQATGFQLSDTTDSVLVGGLTRAPGEHVAGSPYAISQGTLAADGDYTIRFTASSLIITPAPLTITADDQAKVYGQNDPILSYQVSGLQLSDTASSVLSGGLSRASGEHVGRYAIGQGTLTSDSDYTIGFTGNSLSITPATLTVTTEAQTKVYGQPDPGLTYQAAGFRFGDTASSVLTGGLVRVAGEHVGRYAISQGTLTADGDYTISYTGNALTITPATLTVTADAQAKVYGAADPMLAYGVSGLQFSDTASSVLTGGLARAAGEHAGSYAIGQGSLGADGDYTISFTGDSLSITPAPLTITADARTKVYGGADPALTYQATGFQFSDTAGSVLSGGLAQAAGEHAGSYVISQGTLVSDSDYTIRFTGNTLTITPYAFTYHIGSDSQTYGSPANLAGDLPATISTGINGENLAIAYTSAGDAATAHVGSYAITGALGDGTGLMSDYSVTLINGTLTVNPKALTVTAADESKTYGDTVTFAETEFTHVGLINGDTVTSVALASPGAAATATVPGSPYAITPGAAVGTGLSNYTIRYVTGALTVNKAHLTITADAQSKTYGDANPPLTATITGFVNGDTASVLSGSPTLSTTATESSAVGSYPITVVDAGTLSAANYDFPAADFADGTLTVTARPITVTADPQAKVYGQPDPALTFQITSGSLVGGDSFTGGLTRAAGESVAGGPFAIREGTLSAGSNYDLTYVGSDLAIIPAALTVTADAQTKVYGQPDPGLTYVATGFQLSDTAVDVLGGGLARVSGEHVGGYAISRGTLAADSNYTLAFSGNTLTITPATLRVTADAQAKVYGQADPALSYQATGFQFADAAPGVLSGCLARAAGEHVGGYVIGRGSLAADGDYTIAFTASALTVIPASLTITADAQTKVYGAADPVLTYQVSGFQFSDTATAVLSGSLSRAGGEHVGSYAIGQGSLTADSDYSIDFTGNSLTITPAPLTIAAEAQTKVYGTADPTLTYDATGFQLSDTAATVLTGALSRAGGEHVGRHAIGQGSLTSDGDYAIRFAGNLLDITPAALTVTADAQAKVYGQADPGLTYQAAGFRFGDTASSVLTGGLARAAGEHVGRYAIDQGMLASDSDYTLAFTDSTLAITPASLMITADAQAKVYGAADPALIYQAAGFQFSDTAASVLTGGLARAPGEHVGGYPIGQGSLETDGDYTISFTGSTLSITPASLTIAADPQAKVYGQADPALTYQAAGFQFSDTASSVLSGMLSRAVGERVAGSPYAIGQGTLATNSDYALTFIGNTLNITPASLAVTADAHTKVYGQSDPDLTYTATGFRLSDTASMVLSGGLTRVTGEHVGSYPIGQGTLAADSDYTLSLTGNTLTITPATLIVFADSQTKVYGDADPMLTYHAMGFQFSDTVGTVLSGGLARAAGEHAGHYAISKGSLVANSDYTISFMGNRLAITPATLTITANAQTKVYGQADPILTCGVSGLRFSDTASGVLTGALSRALGEHVAGNPYPVTQGTLAADNDYTISFTASSLSITPATLTVTADAQFEVHGQGDPTLSYVATGFQFSDTSATVLSGGLTRSAGEHVGRYAIGRGTLTSDGDYTLAFTGNSLTITPATLTITADAQTKVYGSADPALTYHASGFQFSDTAATVLTGSLSRAAGEHVGSYAIGQGTLAADGDYTIRFTGSTLSITPAVLTVTPIPAPLPLVTMAAVCAVTNKKHRVTQILISFSGALNTGEADRLATYRLVTAGKQGPFTAKTAKVIKIRSAVCNPENNTVTIIPKKRFSLRKPVQLQVSAQAPSGLHDSLGRLIDGDHNGQPGGNAVATLQRSGATINGAAYPTPLPFPFPPLSLRR
jgi:hypothetical protein